MSPSSQYTGFDYRQMFPQLSDFGVCQFGEDADVFGDTISELIDDVLASFSLTSKVAARDELRTLLAYEDDQLATATWAIIGFNPTVESAALPDAVPYPSLRAFWEDVAQALDNDPYEGDSITPNSRNVGGCVVRRHIDLVEDDIEDRLFFDKIPAVSVFASKTEAEGVILHTLQANTDRIDAWVKRAPDGERGVFRSVFPHDVGRVERIDGPQPHAGQELAIAVTKMPFNGMVYYVHTIRIYDLQDAAGQENPAPRNEKTFFEKIRGFFK